MNKNQKIHSLKWKEWNGRKGIGQSFEKIIDLNPDLIISWGAANYE